MKVIKGSYKVHYYLNDERLPRIAAPRIEEAVCAFSHKITAVIEITIERGCRTKVIHVTFPGLNMGKDMDIPAMYTLQFHNLFQSGYKFGPTAISIWKKALQIWAKTIFNNVFDEHREWTLLKNRDYPLEAQLKEHRMILQTCNGMIATCTWKDKNNKLLGFGTAIEIPYRKGGKFIQRFNIGNGQVAKVQVGSIND